MHNTACDHHEHRHNDGSQTPTERSANRSVEFVLLRGRPLFPQMQVQGKTQQTEQDSNAHDRSEWQAKDAHPTRCTSTAPHTPKVNRHQSTSGAKASLL